MYRLPKGEEEKIFLFSDDHVRQVQEHSVPATEMILEACTKLVSLTSYTYERRHISKDSKREITARVFYHVYTAVMDRHLNNREEVVDHIKKATWRHIKRHTRERNRLVSLNPAFHVATNTEFGDWEHQEYLGALVGSISHYITVALGNLTSNERQLLESHYTRNLQLNQQQRCRHNRRVKKIREKLGHALLRHLRVARHTLPADKWEEREFVTIAISLIESQTIDALFSLIRKYAKHS